MKSSPVILSLILMLSYSLSAQETVSQKQRELYLTTTALSPVNFGFQYKTSANEKVFFRLGLLDLSASMKNYEYTSPTLFGFTDFYAGALLNMGIEFRRDLTPAAGFWYGFDLLENVSYSYLYLDNPNLVEEFRTVRDLKTESGIGFPVGFIFNLRHAFSLSAELEPSLLYRYSLNDIVNGEAYTTENTLLFNMSLSSVSVSLVYRIGK